MTEGKEEIEKSDSVAVYEARDTFSCLFCGEEKKKSNPRQKYCDSEHKRLYHWNIYLQGKAYGGQSPKTPFQLEEIDKASSDLLGHQKRNNSQIARLFRYMRLGTKTSIQISQYLPTGCSTTLLSDLRKQGCIVKRQYLGKSKKGRQINRYTLTFAPASVVKKYG